MSTKATVFYDPDSKTHLFDEVSIGDTAVPAYIELLDPKECSVTKNINGKVGVTICIDSEIMDGLAVAWCKHRKLQGEAGGPVGKEYGSPDCEYE